jgi:hypothetical protein
MVVECLYKIIFSFAKAKIIAQECHIEFDPSKFNFFGKWLWRFKMKNNINHTLFREEGEAASLTPVSIVR